MTSTEVLSIIINMTGGLALFLFGMDTMSRSLGQMTDALLGKISGVVSGNRIVAFLFGTGLTAVVQSSSAITVLTVGLVNAGIIELEKAAGLLIGANLGTTATAWLLSLNAVGGQSLWMLLIKPSTFSPFLAIIGVVLNMFAKSQKTRTTGSAILGFSVMMIGMNMMSTGAAPLKDLPALKAMLVSFSNPILGFGFAMLFTMLIQSSDATIGIVQVFALSVGITFGSAVPLICGAQTGTCITALISSLGTSNNGKRTAFMNLYYNLLKTIPFMILFYSLNAVFRSGMLQSSVGAVGIPACHTLINLFGAALWLPGAGMIVRLAGKTVPLSPEEREAQENTLVMLEPFLVSRPAFALEQTENAVNLLAETVRSAFEIFVRDSADPDSQKTVQTLCRRAKLYEDQIAAYLMEISSKNTLDKEAAWHVLLSSVNSALGRIGMVTSYAVNKIAQTHNDHMELTESTRQELFVFGQAVYEIIEMTVLGLKVKEPSLYSMIQMYHEEITRMASLVTMRRIEQMHRTGADLTQKSFFSEFLTSEERLIDCCDIIADALVKYALSNGGFRETDALKLEEKRKQVAVLFKDKYKMLGF